MSKASVYLIPNLLGSEAKVSYSLPAENVAIIQQLSFFAVENLKDARRFLVKIGLKSKIDESTFVQVNKRSSVEELSPILAALKKGESVGMISDAGCPGIADPGALLASLAHQHYFQVRPLIGPSSILLALMASGFNGQSFAFNGYLDRDKDKRIKQLKSLEINSKHQSQLFMETPYRNQALLEDVLKSLNPSTMLCIAKNISLPNEFIRSKSIAEWRKLGAVDLNKQPCIFIIDNSMSQ